MGVKHLSSLEHKYVPEGKTELTKGYDKAGLDGMSPGEGYRTGPSVSWTGVWLWLLVASALPPLAMWERW